MKKSVYCSLLLTVMLTACGQTQETVPPSQKKRIPLVKPFLRKLSVALGTAGFFVSYLLYKQFKNSPPANIPHLSPTLYDTRLPILLLPISPEPPLLEINSPPHQATISAEQDPSPIISAIPALPSNLTALARSPSPATLSDETPRSTASDSSSLGRSSFDSDGTQSGKDSPRPEPPHPVELVFSVEPAPKTSDIVPSPQPSQEALHPAAQILVPLIPDIQPVAAHPQALSPQAMPNETPRPQTAHSLTKARISQDAVETELVPTALDDSPHLDGDPIFAGLYAAAENSLGRPLKGEVRLTRQTSRSSLTSSTPEKTNSHKKELVAVFNEQQLVTHFLTELINTGNITDHCGHPLLQRIMRDEAFKAVCKALGVNKAEQPTTSNHQPTVFHHILPLRKSKEKLIPERPRSKPIIQKTSALEEAEARILDVVIAVHNNKAPVTELENIIRHYGPMENALIYALAQEFAPEKMRRGLVSRAVGYLLKEHNTLATLEKHTDITDTEIYQSLFLTLQSSLYSSEQSLRNVQNRIAINNALVILSAQKSKLLSELANQKKELERVLLHCVRARCKVALELEVLRLFANA